MRLRKNMKRTAAAVLALSMAVSAVAAPASAAYICNVSKGDVVVSVDKSGTSITVGGKKVENDGDGSEDIIITGDNTKPTASLNAAEENSDEVEKSGENTSEAEKSGETKTEGEGKTQNPAAEGEDEGDEPTSQELLAPEDEQKKTEQKPAETQEPEQDKKTEKTSDQVIEYGQYDPEAQKEAAKPAAEQKAEEKKAAEEKTYGDTNAPTSLSESVQTAANNVVKIINKSKETLKVILRDLKVDAGNTNKSAVTVSGTGNVTLELDGKNELTGGSGYTGGRKAAGVVVASDDAKLTIQGKEGSSLSATGGAGTGESDNYDGYGIRAGKLDLMDATVTATGGVETEKDSNIKNSKLIANGGIGTNGKFTVGEGGEVIAIGKDVKTTDGKAQGGNALWLLGNRQRL